MNHPTPSAEVARYTGRDPRTVDAIYARHDGYMPPRERLDDPDHRDLRYALVCVDRDKHGPLFRVGGLFETLDGLKDSYAGLNGNPAWAIDLNAAPAEAFIPLETQVTTVGWRHRLADCGYPHRL